MFFPTVPNAPVALFKETASWSFLMAKTFKPKNLFMLTTKFYVAIFDEQ